jgi:YhcH/YjgK/YiaL family protein
MIISSMHPVSNNPENWSKRKTVKWFLTAEWKSGWEICPDESINQKEFAKQFFKNNERWEKAFNFLKTTDLKNISLGKHELDGNNLFVNVDEYTTRNEEDSRFEAHKKYADIQYLVYGEEKIGITAPDNTIECTIYDDLKDIIFLAAEINYFRLASPERFFIFFPDDAHRPCVKNNENSKVRKVVVKVRIN